MFKCCISNNISKKTNAETKSKADDISIESPKLTTISTRVDDEIKILMRADKLNGNLQISEDTFSAALDLTPVCTNSTIKNSCEIAQNENANIKDKSNLIDKGNSNFNNADENQMENVNSGAFSAIKTNLYDASGYIERTIDDGPEDEGDDSVFEACPSGNETAKKAPPVASIPRWLSEEDDGEYVTGGFSGMQEPPATPVARDELALRRHRFFSDLLQAAQNSTEHRVRFDPLGPMVHTG